MEPVEGTQRATEILATTETWPWACEVAYWTDQEKGEN